MRALLVLLLLLPVATASISNPDGDFDAVLYLHLNGQQEIQLNPLPPPTSFVHDRGPGGLTQSACIDTPGQGLTNQQLHTWYAVVTPTRVVYKNDFAPEVITERGIRDDLRLVDRPMALDWYMRVESSAGQPIVAPQVTVEATVREGDDISVKDAALNAGRIVAQAATETATLSPALSGHPQVTYNDATQLYHVHMELAPRAPLVIPQRESFNLRIDVRADVPYCNSTDGYAMPDVVSIVSMPAARPALTVPLRNPVTIDRLSAVVDDELVRLQADVRAVFGAGDAILADDTVLFQGPTEATTVSGTAWGAATIVDGRAFPQRADIGLQALHAWAFKADKAVSGVYNATLTLHTESGATATAVVPFGLGTAQKTCTVLATGEPSCSLDARQDKRTPAPLIPLALLGAAWLRRR